jgi:hypothetical protein
MLHHLKILTAVGVTTAVAWAQMQPVVTDEQGDGNVDWAARVIVVTGIGAPNPELPEAAQRPGAERAAQQVALRNALETVKGIFINSSTTVENFMTKSDMITSRVNGFVKGFQQKGRTRYMSDGSVEITMEIPIDGFGFLGEMVIGEQLGDNPSVTKFEGKKSREEKLFTGLIIDCRGLSVKPALSPRVLDGDGREVYGSAYVSKEWAVKYGMVGYSKDVAAAAKLERVGKTPGSVKAEKAMGDNKTDVVIADADAEDIRSAAKNLKFLSECRVIFVVD